MDEEQLYNRQINVDASYYYIRKHGLKISTAVEANSFASQKCVRMSNVYQEHMSNFTKDDVKDIKDLWNCSLNQAQIGNAYAWMMIKTAIDEKTQGWKYIEDGDKYIKHITDNGVRFTDEERANISMIRYYSQLYNEALSKKYFKSFTDGNLQYWYMRLNDLDKEAENV